LGAGISLTKKSTKQKAPHTRIERWFMPYKRERERDHEQQQQQQPEV